MSSVTKLKLDLYYVIKNLYTRISNQVNISKECREKSGKPKCDGLADILTDGRTDRQRAN